jgi:hypothetical protein
MLVRCCGRPLSSLNTRSNNNNILSIIDGSRGRKPDINFALRLTMGSEFRALLRRLWRSSDRQLSNSGNGLLTVAPEPVDTRLGGSFLQP